MNMTGSFPTDVFAQEKTRKPYDRTNSDQIFILGGGEKLENGFLLRLRNRLLDNNLVPLLKDQANFKNFLRGDLMLGRISLTPLNESLVVMCP